MAFEFPASPAIGDQANGFTWNGSGWAGGPGLAGPQTEQFFDAAGLSSVDMQVPTWAKGVTIEGSVFSAVGNTYLRVSFDGTTFLAGASDYIDSSALHNTGSSGYQTGVSTPANAVFIAGGGDQSATVAVNFRTQMRLVRPTTGQAFEAVTYGKNADSSAASAHRTYWYYGWPSTGVSSALAVKALRLQPSTGNFNAGSWVRVRWIGDSASLPPSNAIADCPSDSWEYTRVNGIWVQKQRTFDVSGLTSLDIPVPATARTVELQGSIFTTAYTAQTLQVSLDGTTFIAGASSYFMQGQYHDSGTSPYYGTQGNSATSYMQMNFGGDNLSIPSTFVTLMSLFSPTGKLLTAQSWATAFRSTAPLHARTTLLLNYLNSPAGPLQVKALRYSNSAVAAAAANSYLTVRWM